MRFFVFFLLFLSCSYFETKSKNPKAGLRYSKVSDIALVNKTTPYNKNMCRAKKYIPAYSFVLKGSEFDRDGCVQPIEAWIFDSEIGKWVYIDANFVKCCNPLKGFKQLSF